MQEVMPFGVHKGKRISETPRGYLRWLLGQDWLKEPLRGEVQKELGQEPTTEAAVPGPNWQHYLDRSHLAPDLEARIHAVVKDAGYWLGRGR